MTTEEQNWYTFASKLNSFLIDKGYKMEYSNNFRQYYLDNVPHFIINYNYQEINFTIDLYSRWYSMSFKDADGKKIQEQLRELLEKYGNNDFVCFAGSIPWVMIGQQFVVRIEPLGYAFLTEYLFRPRFKYALGFHYKNRGKGQKIGVYTDLEKLVHDYVQVKKDFQVKEKLQKMDEDF